MDIGLQHCVRMDETVKKDRWQSSFGVPGGEICALEVQETRFRESGTHEKWLWANDVRWRRSQRNCEYLEKTEKISCFMSQHRKSYEKVMCREKLKKKANTKKKLGYVDQPCAAMLAAAPWEFDMPLLEKGSVFWLLRGNLYGSGVNYRLAPTWRQTGWRFRIKQKGATW